MKMIANIMLKIFSYGIIACLFAGGLSLAGYVVALIIGGESATALCLWIYKTYLPWVIKATTLFTGIGLLGIYLGNSKVLMASTDRKKSTTYKS